MMDDLLLRRLSRGMKKTPEEERLKHPLRTGRGILILLAALTGLGLVVIGVAL